MERTDTILTIFGLDKEVETTADAYAQFRTLKELQKMMDDRSKKLRTKLFDLAEKAGTQDEKGTYTVQFEDGTGYQKQARTSIKLKTVEAIDYMKTHNIKGIIEENFIIPKDEERKTELMTYLETTVPSLLDKEEKINESLLEEAVLNGEVPMSDFEKMVNRKVVYAMIDLDKTK